MRLKENALFMGESMSRATGKKKGLWVGAEKFSIGGVFTVIQFPFLYGYGISLPMVKHCEKKLSLNFRFFSFVLLCRRKIGDYSALSNRLFLYKNT